MVLAVRQSYTFDSKLLWYTEEFMVSSMTARCVAPVAAKQHQVITSSPMRMSVGISQSVGKQPEEHEDQILTLFQKSCGLFRPSFMNLRCAVIFRRRMFSPGNPSKQTAVVLLLC